ncbi:XRE family transcriptional regulator [Paenibacillus sp. A3]|uniref:helix-turn-helix domain-containing protein n=1 Tax=Paenibacillus sp. A3 TaxID=1337054 RepID=UPI0006D5961A|nr:helix-turn-helix transcriptional regulator [Paenibacillus sp. A3]KPV60430.1 XRE family transcriptional regulator [Paenibacillus sp. A3]
MPTIAERLKDLREQNQVKREELAQVLGVSVRSISHYESGNRRPDYEGLLALADYFNVSLDYLVGRSNDPEKH